MPPQTRPFVLARPPNRWIWWGQDHYLTALQGGTLCTTRRMLARAPHATEASRLYKNRLGTNMTHGACKRQSAPFGSPPHPLSPCLIRPARQAAWREPNHVYPVCEAHLLDRVSNRLVQRAAEAAVLLAAEVVDPDQRLRPDLAAQLEVPRGRGGMGIASNKHITMSRTCHRSARDIERARA